MLLILFEDLRQYELLRNLARKARFPEGLYKFVAYLVLHGRTSGSGGKRSCIGEPIQQELETQEMIAVGMGDAYGCEILAAVDKPFCQFLRMLHGQKRIDEDGISFTINKRYGVGDPGEIFLAWRKSLGDARALLSQKLPIQLRHKYVRFSICHVETSKRLTSRPRDGG